ncbi:MAG TPA: hypothetical protein VJ890_20525, partial [Vineibacter sp.]|nr:hypothetical protein [Vineibacter sp.]
VALGVVLDPALSVVAFAQSAAPPQIRINARVEGWDELSFEPRTWRCGRCDPPIMVTAQQSSVAWQAHDPPRMRAADSRAFADMVLADSGQRADFVENLLGHLRQRFPAHEVRATLSGRKTIGGFAFIEAQVTLRRDSDLTSMASYTAVHKGAMIQLAAMYVVFGPRPLAVREIERFLGGVSIEE